MGRGCTTTRPHSTDSRQPFIPREPTTSDTEHGIPINLHANQMVGELQLTINKDPGKAGNVNVRHPLPTLQPATDGGGGSRPTAPWLCNRQSESEISKPLCMPTRKVSPYIPIARDCIRLSSSIHINANPTDPPRPTSNNQTQPREPQISINLYISAINQ